jgi:hypothetical protein
MLAYITAELSRRKDRSISAIAGLALAGLLIVSVQALAAGLQAADVAVLHPLNAIGADVMVTRPVTGAQVTESDLAALNSERRTADQANLLNLASLGSPGQPFSQDFFAPTSMLTFDDGIATTIHHLPGVKLAAGALTVEVDHREGTVPAILATFKSQPKVLQAPQPTPAEQAQTDACVARLPEQARTSDAIFNCLPQRLREVQVQQQVLRDVIGAPSTDIRGSAFIVGGVDLSSAGSGLVTPSQLVRGRFLRCCSGEVLLDETFSERSGVGIGGEFVIGGHHERVVGLVRAPIGQTRAFISLTELQQVSSRSGRVDYVFVRAQSSDQVSTIEKEIKKHWPSLRVTGADETVRAVSGSLVAAAAVLATVKGALTILVLAAGGLYSGLLTVASVRRRYGELAVLRAIGWTRLRLATQIGAEATVLGVAGPLTGLALGWVGVVLAVPRIPALSAQDPSTGRIDHVRVTTVADPLGWLTVLSVLTLVTVAFGVIAGIRAGGGSPAGGLIDVE